MCGIAGMIGREPEESRILAMLSSMHHRGPDGNGIYRDQDALLLHTRLAIIDLAGGEQPMTCSYGNEEYVLIYNGELYNTEQLRRELTALGHRFRTRSDTEVILRAYVQYGDSCVDRFNGIFAFAVWEKKARRLFLARDRIGVKPLFYAQVPEGLVFGSEIKTLLASGCVPARLDEMGAGQLLLLGPGRMPGSGVFRDIREMEPGCCGFYTDGMLTTRRYWFLRDREHRETFEETLEQVRYLVTDAIKCQMVSDVGIGTFLSGGLDSSIITAVCARELEERGQVLPTFCVDYENNHRYFRSGKFQPDSDAAYICLMSQTLGTEHHRTVLTSDDLLGVLEQATAARDLPGMADVDFSLLAFCSQVRRHVKVVLSGECADEIFGGYPWYRDPEIREQAGFPWAQNTLQRAELLAPSVSLQAGDFVMEAYNRTCRESDILPGTPPQDYRMKQMVNLNFRWFMQTLLDRKDRMSMQHGLEVRVPFCDYRIAEYLYGVPWEFKDWQGREKGLLRQAVQGLLPEEIRTRKKSPYPKTFDPGYTQLVQDRFRDLLSQDSPLWHLVRRDQALLLPQQQSVWPWYGQLMGHPQTLAYFLQLDCWLKTYRVNFCF